MKHLKLFFALFAMLALGVGNAWGEEVTYVFTSKDWAAKIGSTAANWTSNKAGAGFSNNGIQVTIAASGANGTSPISYNNISQIVVTYNTNKSAGQGTLGVKIGENAATTKNWKYAGTADGRSAKFTSTFDYTSPQSGKVTLTANTTTNSIYVVSIKIVTLAGTEPPTPTQLTAPTGLAVDDITSSGATLSWNAVDNASSYVVTIVDGGSLEKDYPVTGITTTVSDLESSTDYLWTVTAVGDGTNYTNSEESETGEFTTSAPASGGEGDGEETWTLVTNASDLKAGDKVVIAASGYNYAMASQNGNYRNRISITKDGNNITINNDVQILTIEEGTKSNTYAFNTGSGYLYACSSGSNYLKTQTTNDDNGSWAITITNTGEATIVAQGDYTRNMIQYNANSGQERFSCYATDKPQKPVSIYKKITSSGSGTEETAASLTVNPNSLDFGTVAQNATVTETLNVSGGYLAEDVTLTISGINASFFSVNLTTIAKADKVDQDVTITYNPTATGDHTATLTIKTGEITKTVALSGKVLAPGKWALVKNVTELSAGDEVIIASASSNYAIGIAASNNYKGAAITKVGETANATADVTILTVEETGVAEAPYAFKTDGKYLYAASSSANQLKAQATNNTNGQWAVTITAEGVASIVAAKSTNRNVMQCNPNDGSPIFACYKSASYQQLAIYRNSENVVKPIISGDTDFTGSTYVTITAQSGLTVYYTTDGTDPNNTSAQYTAPFTINATTTVKAIAYDASSNASGVAEMTFTKHELVNVATAMALAKDAVAYFDEFEVVKVVTGKGNIYIKDASGHGLIYDNTLAGELKDGDRVQGFVGISSPYNGLPEAKPYNVTYADLTITAGTAAKPYDFTSTAIASTDINKYVVFNDVEIATAVSMSNSNKEFSLTINGNNVKFYNQFSIEKTLEADKTYDIYGFVATYNSNLQVYFYQALEEGEVVTKYTVTYKAGGATGEVPVDDNKYTKGAQVYLKSATSLTKEGYDYKGWKVTDEGGNEIAVSSNKFNMPASNVTVTAQWEKIVVTPREDFSAGLWVLVTDASELAADDYIIVAAKDYNVAMVSYDYDVRKNNCGQTNITKFGNNNCFLTWKEEIGVFQLANSGSGYTIQDVNTEQYLYAAGTGTNNYLKAADEVPTDAEAAKPYIWTISYTDGVATVKATSDNRNTLMYNATNNTGQLFSCYASGQKAIAIYRYVTDFYTRDVTPDEYGTICIPYGSNNYTGAEFYEVSSVEYGKGLWLDQLAAGTALVAGKPYIFKATAEELAVVYKGEKKDSPVDGINGLTGTFTDIAANTDLVGHYIIALNQIWVANDKNTLPAYRAYINADEVPTTAQAQLPGRRRVCMGENAATGFENVTNGENNTIKVIENGQLFIIRNGEKYNIQGQKL